MPTLICPHCQTPQAVSDEVFQKNLGKKCRCRQCQKTFTIEAQATSPAAEPGGFGDFDFLNEASPAPTAPPPAPAKPKAAAKPAAAVPVAPAAEPEGLGDFDFLNVDASAPAAPPPAPAKPKSAAKPAPTTPAPSAPAPVEELDFSGLMAGSGSITVADLPDFASPAASSAPVMEAPEFPSFDAVAPAPATAASAAPTARTPLTRLPQPAADDAGNDVAKLPARTALRMIAGILWIIGWLYVAGTGLAILLVLFAVTKDVKPSSGGFSIVPIMLTPLIFAASALCWFAFAELILLGLSMEARLHEISRRIRPRS